MSISLKIKNSIDLKENEGVSIIEFLVAMGIFLVVVGGGALSILGSLSANRHAQDHIQASAYAQEGLEATKAIRNNSWDALQNGTYGLTNQQGYWEFLGVSDIPGTRFTRTITVEDAILNEVPQQDTKRIVSRVTWFSTPARQSQVEFATYLTKWQTVRAFVPGGQEVGSCPAYCGSLGYDTGNCMQHPGQCTVIHVPYADQYCVLGPSADTCCCE